MTENVFTRTATEQQNKYLIGSQTVCQIFCMGWFF